MIDFFRPTERYSAQTQRLVARAQYGAADVFEIADVARSLDADDLDGWIAAWTQLGDTAQRDAQTAQAAGHRATAIARWFHASTYYQQSDIFTPSGEERRVEPFRKSQAAFRAGAALLGPEIRTTSVRCGNDSYDAYFCLPPNYRPGTRVPGVLFIGGGDAYTEETYFSGKGVLERGMAMLLVDLPGRGSSIYLKGIGARPEFELPGRASMDVLAAQPEIDPERLGVAGISFGGYYAPRLAAFDERVKALVCWGAITSVLDNIYDFHPRSRNNHRWITQSPDDEAARALIAQFTLRGLTQRITCPTLITHGARDTISDVRGARELFEAIPATDKQLVIYDGPGAGHCSYDDWRHTVPVMFDFLADRLAAT